MRYSSQNKVNCSWIARRKAMGDDLSDYRRKMGKAVSDAIMSNPGERARRALQMAANNRTPEAKELARNTAKKTSTRPEIQAVRAANLQRWRDENFDVFYEKCIMKMHSTWHSKPELALFELLRHVDGYQFKHNQIVKSETFTCVSKRKQVDVADAGLRVYVEFDGIVHFDARIKGSEKLTEIQQNDRLLDEHIERHAWTLIRISYDQFTYKDGGRFSERCLRRLFELLKDPKPGVFRLGDAYCTGVIPSTFIACGEGYNYCSDWCILVAQEQRNVST